MKRYQLRDQATGFFDPETGLKIVRDQVVEIEEPGGKLTTHAIAHGRLIEAEDAQPEAEASAGGESIDTEAGKEKQPKEPRKRTPAKGGK